MTRNDSSSRPAATIPPLDDVEGRCAAEVPPLGATLRELDGLHPIAIDAARDIAETLRTVESMCLFLGHPRSGHSLVASMLDAHPEIIIANELDLVRMVVRGWEAPESLWACLENSRRSAAVGRLWGRYRYAVPDQWQGRWRKLRIVGDKKGDLTSVGLARDPEVLDRVLSTFPVPIRWVHITRNPWDNISTIARKNKNFSDIKSAMAAYFSLARNFDQVSARLPAGSILTLRHEDVLSNPSEQLLKLVDFLQIGRDEAWLEACEGVVWSKPSRPRDQAPWPPPLRRTVQVLAAQHPWLAHYRFDD